MELEPGDYFEQWCEVCQEETEHQVLYANPKRATCLECAIENQVTS